MEVTFIPSPDVAVVLNSLLDILERRAPQSGAPTTQHAPHSIRVTLTNLSLPAYFSQTDPTPRIIANEQLQILEHADLIHLNWLSGEIGHILQSVALPKTELHPERSRRDTTRNTELFHLLSRTPQANNRSRLESLLLAEKFRFPKDDWRARALDYILHQLRAGKSPSPFSLTDSNLDLDLLAVLQALPTLTAETPYRVFSVRVFNDSKRFDDLKPALVRLARRANPEWKSLVSEDLLRELNLVANPGYIHLAGNWELTDADGQIINLDCFTPSIGFPASQITSLQKITIHAESVLCIENLTSFHEFTRTNGTRNTKYDTRYTPLASLCLMGNPSPAIRYLLHLIPEETPIYLWSDMDYGGFNILSQLRRQVSTRVRPYLMDIATFDKYAHLSRPLTQSDARNLKRLTHHPILKDTHPIIEHLIQQELKLEQEAIQI